MIKKIFVTAGVLLALYSLLIKILGGELRYSQNYWQDNMLVLQRFVYNPTQNDNIILGSSLSLTGLNNLTPDYYNLAAGGANPFTGLEIIKRTHKKVKRVFIETNYLLSKSPADDRYLGSIFTPVLYDARKYLPVLLQKSQPFSLTGGWLTQTIFPTVSVIDEKGLNPTMRAARIANFKQTNADSVAIKPTVEKNITRLAEYLAHLRSQGVELYFFEMPVDCALTNNAQPVYFRNQINNFCKQYNIQQLASEPCDNYNTKDGNHLDSASAEKYKQFFYSQVAKLHNPQPALR